MSDTLTLKIRLTPNVVAEMWPAVEAARLDSNDEGLRSLWPLLQAIRAGRPVKDGTMVTLTGADAIRGLRVEAGYRAGHVMDQASDEWEHGARARLLGVASSFRAIVRKCDALLPVVEPAPVPVLEDGPCVVERDVWFGPFIVSHGRRIPAAWFTAEDGRLLDWHDSRAVAEAAAEAFWAARVAG
jgi:hypothetical protein